MSWLLPVLSGFTVGIGSALLPLLNAEAYAILAAGRRPNLVVWLVLTLALGQTVGKLLLYEAARRGSNRLRTRAHHASPRNARWAGRIRSGLTDRRTAVPLVLSAASIGLPPLAVVSIAAGVAGQPRVVFAVTCLIGRTARFAVIAAPAAVLLTRS